MAHPDSPADASIGSSGDVNHGDSNIGGDDQDVEVFAREFNGDKHADAPSEAAFTMSTVGVVIGVGELDYLIDSDSNNINHDDNGCEVWNSPGRSGGCGETGGVALEPDRKGGGKIAERGNKEARDVGRAAKGGLGGLAVRSKSSILRQSSGDLMSLYTAWDFSALGKGAGNGNSVVGTACPGREADTALASRGRESEENSRQIPDGVKADSPSGGPGNYHPPIRRAPKNGSNSIFLVDGRSVADCGGVIRVPGDGVVAKRPSTPVRNGRISSERSSEYSSLLMAENNGAAGVVPRPLEESQEEGKPEILLPPGLPPPAAVELPGDDGGGEPESVDPLLVSKEEVVGKNRLSPSLVPVGVRDERSSDCGARGEAPSTAGFVEQGGGAGEGSGEGTREAAGGGEGVGGGVQAFQEERWNVSVSSERYDDKEPWLREGAWMHNGRGNGSNDDRVVDAVVAGDTRAIEAFLTRGGDVDTRDSRIGMTLLGWAARRGHLDMVRLLLGRGAAVMAGDGKVRTPLHRASSGCHDEVVRVLLKHGADPDARDLTRRTPLHHAGRWGSPGTSVLLLDAGADIEARDEELARTPLHFSSRSGGLGTTLVLLQNGADLDAKTVAGNTPLHLACDRGLVENVKLLLEWGANRKALNEAGNVPAEVAASWVEDSVKARLRELLSDEGQDGEGNEGVATRPRPTPTVIRPRPEGAAEAEMGLIESIRLRQSSRAACPECRPDLLRSTHTFNSDGTPLGLSNSSSYHSASLMVGFNPADTATTATKNKGKKLHPCSAHRHRSSPGEGGLPGLVGGGVGGSEWVSRRGAGGRRKKLMKDKMARASGGGSRKQRRQLRRQHPHGCCSVQ